VYVSGIGFPDGIAFDEAGHLFVAGAGIISVVIPGEPPLVTQSFVTSGVNGPASLAFGFGSGRNRELLYFTNFGFPALGSGTTVGSVLVGIPGMILEPFAAGG
jgi:hypothetical protein